MSRKVAYHVDLRRSALNLVQSGQTQTAVAQLLGISRSSIVRWLKRPALEPSLRGGSKPRELGIELKDLVAQNPGKTLIQMSKLIPIEKTALCIRLRKAGFTFKKKLYIL